MIYYKKQAAKYIESCDKPTRNRLRAAIEKLPSGDVVRLKGTDSYRLRVGELRILFEIIDADIIINAIGSRGQIYKGIER